MLQRYVAAVERRRDLDWLPARLALRAATVPSQRQAAAALALSLPEEPPPEPARSLASISLKFVDFDGKLLIIERCTAVLYIKTHFERAQFINHFTHLQTTFLEAALAPI